MKIKLINPGNNKIDLIKVIRQITDLPLKDSKTISETPNAIFEIKDGLNLELLKQIFEKIGTTAEFINEEKTEIQFQPESLDLPISPKKYEIAVKSYSDKLITIKLLRDFTQLPISVCNRHTENLPAYFEINTTYNNLENFINLAAKNNVVVDFKEITESEEKIIPQQKKEEEIKHFVFFLTSAGRNKIQVIKTLREFTDAPLYECKKFTDFTPSKFFVKSKIKLVTQFMEQMKLAGATISFDVTKNVAGQTIYTNTGIKPVAPEKKKEKSQPQTSKQILEPKQKTEYQTQKKKSNQFQSFSPPTISKKTDSYTKKTNTSQTNNSKGKNTNRNKNIYKNANNEDLQKKEHLRNLIKQQNPKKAFTSALIWIEIFSLMGIISFYFSKPGLFGIFLFSSIISASIYKSKGKIVEKKYRINAMFLIVLQYLQIVGFVLLINYFNNLWFSFEFALKVLLNFNLLLSTSIGLFFAYLLSAKKTDFSIIQHEIEGLSSTTNRIKPTKRKNLHKSEPPEDRKLFYLHKSSKHKSKYSSRKRDLKFKP